MKREAEIKKKTQEIKERGMKDSKVRACFFHYSHVIVLIWTETELHFLSFVVHLD